MKEGGTSLHKTIREINLVYKGLKDGPVIQRHSLCSMCFNQHTYWEMWFIDCLCIQCSTSIVSLHTYSSVQGHGKGHVRIVKEGIGKLVLQEGKVTIITIDGFHGACQLISSSEPVVQRILVSTPEHRRLVRTTERLQVLTKCHMWTLPLQCM